MNNGSVANSAAVAQMQDWQDVQGGNAAIVKLNQRDTVWIETFHANDVEIHGQDGFTCFSGFLIYE